MKGTKRIDFRNLPNRPPFLATLVIWMALDHWCAPSWVYGAAAVLMAIAWVSWIAGLMLDERIDIFDDR